MSVIKLNVEWTEEQAIDYAMFYKRLTFSMARELTNAGQTREGRDAEARDFLAALGMIAEELKTRWGIDPR